MQNRVISLISKRFYLNCIFLLVRGILARNGVPTIPFRNSDPLGYNFSYYEIWHTTRDTYNMSIAEYMEYTSVTQAVTLYNIANLKNLLPRNQIYLND